MFDQPDFKYYLTYLNQRVEVLYSPKGWEGNSIVGYKRDGKYFGLIRSWALPLDFTFDGANILRQAYYSRGIQAGVKIEVEELNKDNMSYVPGFTGDIDFSEFKDNGTTVSVTLMESGLSQDVKARDKIEYEYPLIGADVVDMELPGVPFTESATSTFLPNEGRRRDIPGSTLVINSFESEYAEVQDVFPQGVGDDSFSTSDNWFVKANKPVKMRIQGNIIGAFSTNVFGGRGFSIRLMDSNNQYISEIFADNSNRSVVTFDAPFDLELNMVPGQRLYFYIRTDTLTSSEIIMAGGEFTVSYSTVSEPSPCKGLRSIDLYRRIVSRISGAGLAESSLLQSELFNSVIFTSGDAIREIDGAKIKISLQDFFDCINGATDAGMGIESGVLRIESGDYFARLAEIVNVGNVNSCEFSPAKEFMMSSIKIGYEDGNTDNTNGKEEFNSIQEWETPFTRVQNQKNWVSKVRADQYGIEKIRTEYNIKRTKRGTDDTSSDNDTFMIDCYNFQGLVFKPWPGDPLATGVTSPVDKYNMKFTPKRNLLRHGSFLRSIAEGLGPLYYNFAKANKNAELYADYVGFATKERENIAIATLPDPYFSPIIAQIKCQLPVGSRARFDNNMFGFVRFNWNGLGFTGYIMECSVDIAKNTEQEFTLLLTPGNNMLRYAKLSSGVEKRII